MSWAAYRKNGLENRADYPSNPPAHPGLALDRFYLPGEEGEKESLVALHRLLERIAPFQAETYEVVWDRVHRDLDLDGKASFSDSRVGDSAYVAFTVETKSRMLISPNSGSTVTEGSLALHHTYGVPMIPGSTVKGQVRAYLRAIGLDKTLLEDLLGNETERETDQVSGLLHFFDALWDPSSGSEPLARDLVNPHHSEYYTATKNREFPSPSDEPVPAFFMTVRPGQKFRVIFSTSQAASEELLFIAKQWLLPAFESQSFGTKGTSGYGRFSVGDVKKDLNKKQEELAEAKKKAERMATFRTEAGYRCSEDLETGGSLNNRLQSANEWVKNLEQGAVSAPDEVEEVKALLLKFYKTYTPLGKNKRREQRARINAV